jgi:hypothetical protein
MRLAVVPGTSLENRMGLGPVISPSLCKRVARGYVARTTVGQLSNLNSPL